MKICQKNKIGFTNVLKTYDQRNEKKTKWLPFTKKKIFFSQRQLPRRVITHITNDREIQRIKKNKYVRHHDIVLF